MSYRSRRAFTLIELLTVIAIIGILIAGAALYASSVRQNTRDARRISDILEIGKMIDESAVVNRGTYPSDLSSYSNPGPPATSGSNSNSFMCADQMYNSSNSNNLDISAFGASQSVPGTNPIPRDPLPVNSGGRMTNNVFVVGNTCSDVSYGYMYYTQYSGSGRAGSFAVLEKTDYTLAVGLENTLPHDENNGLTTPDSTISATSITGKRSLYILNGPYCGSATCYQ